MTGALSSLSQRDVPESGNLVSLTVKSGGFAYGGTTQNSFATALGGGLDLKVLPFISLRPIQFDYLMTNFNSTHQNQPRVSAGLVLRF